MTCFRLLLFLHFCSCWFCISAFANFCNSATADFVLPILTTAVFYLLLITVYLLLLTSVICMYATADFVILLCWLYNVYINYCWFFHFCFCWFFCSIWNLTQSEAASSSVGLSPHGPLSHEPDCHFVTLNISFFPIFSQFSFFVNSYFFFMFF